MDSYHECKYKLVCYVIALLLWMAASVLNNFMLGMIILNVTSNVILARHADNVAKIRILITAYKPVNLMKSLRLAVSHCISCITMLRRTSQASYQALCRYTSTNTAAESNHSRAQLVGAMLCSLEIV